MHLLNWKTHSFQRHNSSTWSRYTGQLPLQPANWCRHQEVGKTRWSPGKMFHQTKGKKPLFQFLKFMWLSFNHLFQVVPSSDIIRPNKTSARGSQPIVSFFSDPVLDTWTFKQLLKKHIVCQTCLVPKNGSELKEEEKANLQLRIFQNICNICSRYLPL